MSEQQKEYATQPYQRAPWHQRARWWAFTVAGLGSLIAIALLVMLLVPPLSSALAAETADGEQSFAIGDGTTSTVTPEAGWSVQPDGKGLLLHSPDRLLLVKLSPTDQVTLVAKGVLEESLGSGIELRHITEEGYFSGELTTPNSTLRVQANVESGYDSDQSNLVRSLADYRPALATLLESVRI